MPLLIKFIRESLGRTILLADWVTRPTKMKRSIEQQAIVQTDAQKLSLYEHYLCPFCIKTRRALHKLNISVQTRDIRKVPQHREELLNEGGQIQVPCLRIEEGEQVRWMYESNEIIGYLQGRFGGEGVKS